MREHAQVRRLRPVDVDRWRVVAEYDELGALQAHDTEGFRPAAVVADAHPDPGVHRLPHVEAIVPYLEVALLEMLERRGRLVVRVPRQMNLAVAPDRTAAAVDEDRRIEPVAV